MYIGTVGEVLVRDGDVEVVAAEDRDADVECHLVDLDRLTDAVDVEQEEAVVEQRVGVSVMFCAEFFSTKRPQTGCVVLQEYFCTMKYHFWLS